MQEEGVHRVQPQELLGREGVSGRSTQDAVGGFVATSGQKPWPSAGSLVAAYGQFFMPPTMKHPDAEASAPRVSDAVREGASGPQRVRSRFENVQYQYQQTDQTRSLQLRPCFLRWPQVKKSPFCRSHRRGPGFDCPQLHPF